MDRIVSTTWPLTAFAVDPLTPTNLYVGSSRGGVLRSTDGGVTWEIVLVLFGPVNTLAIDPAVPTILYAGSPQQGGLWKSTDGGDTWMVVSALAPGALVIDPSMPTTLYGTGVRGILKSTDGGASWSAADRGLADLRVRDLAIDPENPTTLYAGTQDGVYRSIDGAESWFRLPGGLEGTPILSLGLDPRKPATLYAGTASGVFDIDPVTHLELGGGRFEVAVSWQDYQDLRGPGTVALVPEAAGDVPLRSRDSAVLGFFDPANWELMVKVLDGRSQNGRFWVFFAAATDVAYTLTVTDTSCDHVRTYSNPLGQPSPAVTDTAAFEGCLSPSPPNCVADEDTLCLGEDGRFQVELAWRDYLGNTGVGRQIRVQQGGLAQSDDSGLFFFFNEDNWELLVKVLDGCGFNDAFWVFAAATTDVAYTLWVTDTATGEVVQYSNPLGTASPAITDTAVFATCSQPGQRSRSSVLR